MTQLTTYPGFWISALTIGIARANWIAGTNRTLNRGGAKFLFAWFLMPFAQYGVTDRLNQALASVGSTHKESPLAVFFLNGFPFVGAKMRLRRATAVLNAATGVQPPAGAAVA